MPTSPLNPRRSTAHFDAPDKAPFSVDDTRVFYRETSKHRGGMRMNWVDYQVCLDTRTVNVIYAGGHEVELSGRDAGTFLRIVRDKDSQTFENNYPRNN
jgi:hypothetical protein